MTSGQFTQFPIDRIFVDRAARQRRQVGDVSTLRDSLARVGQIHPIVIQRSGELRVGERRWTAAKELGWTHIAVQFIEDLDEQEMRVVELEENLRRAQLNWYDECLAVEEYHRVQVERDAEWTQEQTAEALGHSKDFVSQHIMVAVQSRTNERVATAPKFSTARTVAAKEVARSKAAAIAAIASPASPTPAAPAKSVPLEHADFNSWAREYTGEPFNFVHCDFPYGVNMQKSEQGANAKYGEYQDDPTTYWRLLNTLDVCRDAIFAPSSHIMFWFSMNYYSETKAKLEEIGFSVNPHPLIWYKSDNVGIIPDAYRSGRRVYETAFFGSLGDRPIQEAVANAFPYPGRDKSIHMSEKPIPMLAHFFRMFVDKYSTVLDPTCGSASAIKAARKAGASRILGLEKNEEFFKLAKENFHDDLSSLEI